MMLATQINDDLEAYELIYNLACKARKINGHKENYDQDVVKMLAYRLKVQANREEE